MSSSFVPMNKIAPTIDEPEVKDEEEQQQEDEQKDTGNRSNLLLQNLKSEKFAPKKNFLFLWFKEKQVEKEFVEYYYGSNFTRFRISAIVLLILYSAYAVWDYLQTSFFVFHIVSRLAVTVS
jgi:hypothetical protein